MDREAPAPSIASRSRRMPHGLLARRRLGRRRGRVCVIDFLFPYMHTPNIKGQHLHTEPNQSHSSIAHGGLIATLLDETLGTPIFVQTMGCATAELSIKYERPVPIPGVVLCRSWVEKTEGRKMWINGVLEDGNGIVYVRGQSLFISFREKL